MKAKILFEDDKYRYFDKNGVELHDEDVIVWDSGKEEKIYLTKQGQLGTDATNPYWIESEMAAIGEFGIYPLSENDLKEIAKKSDTKRPSAYTVEGSFVAVCGANGV